jgi:hypothetical protein
MTAKEASCKKIKSITTAAKYCIWQYSVVKQHMPPRGPPYGGCIRGHHVNDPFRSLYSACTLPQFIMMMKLLFLDPPGPPEIQGYIEGETIRMGQTVSLTCVSHGGNPLAQIVWHRNGEEVDFSYTTSGRESRNMYTFVATSEDNNAKYRCEAKNQMSVEAMTADIVVAVQCKHAILHALLLYIYMLASLVIFRH